MTDDQTAELTWRDENIPVSTRFDDPYFSLDNGLAETRHTFLNGNDIPARLCDGFHVAELGFGTGLNMLAVAQMWQGAGRIKFTSFEAYPMQVDDMEKALASFPVLHELAQVFLNSWGAGKRCFLVGNVAIEVVIGDARASLAAWSDKADAWFLDGFSPAKNPELWEPSLMQQVADHTNPGGTFATYTAAGHVRRALTDAGFTVERRSGFGRKRHMSVGHLGKVAHG